MEGEFQQGPLAETVDRRDVRPVEVANGVSEPDQRVGLLNSEAPPARPQVARLLVGRSARLGDRPARRLKGSSHAGAQFAGGGDREGHDQEIVDGSALFDDQARRQRGQSVGLPRSGARLDQEVGVEGRAEGVAAISSGGHAVAFLSGPSRRRARLSNSSQ